MGYGARVGYGAGWQFDLKFLFGDVLQLEIVSFGVVDSLNEKTDRMSRLEAWKKTELGLSCSSERGFRYRGFALGVILEAVARNSFGGVAAVVSLGLQVHLQRY